MSVELNSHQSICVQMRGVEETSPLTRTTAWRGDYQAHATLRSEFFSAFRPSR